MTAFLATLSASGAGNWEVCKRHRLWGTGTSSHAKAAARDVRDGDPIYVWRSGKGVIAKAVARSTARGPRVDEVPWPDPGRYTYIFDIEVLSELAAPIGDRFKEHRSVRFGIRTHELQAGFIRIGPAVATALEKAVSGGEPSSSPIGTTRSAEPPKPAATTHTADHSDVESGETRWGRPLAGVYLRPASSITEALLALYRRVFDDADGELLVVGDERDRAAVDRELRQPPFSDMRSTVRFVTGEELAADIARRFPGTAGRPQP